MTQLSREDERMWFRQHIKSRAFAMLANPSPVREQINQLSDDAMDERFRLECLLQAAWEGRHASVRWLIEFIGVGGLVDGRAVAPSSKKPHDFRIDDMGGALIDPSSPEATELARLRKDINKATSHPTHASGHEPISEERLRKAAAIIVGHLRKEVYDPAGEKL